MGPKKNYTSKNPRLRVKTLKNLAKGCSRHHSPRRCSPAPFPFSSFPLTLSSPTSLPLLNSGNNHNRPSPSFSLPQSPALFITALGPHFFSSLPSLPQPPALFIAALGPHFFSHLSRLSSNSGQPSPTAFSSAIFSLTAAPTSPSTDLQPLLTSLLVRSKPAATQSAPNHSQSAHQHTSFPLLR